MGIDPIPPLARLLSDVMVTVVAVDIAWTVVGIICVWLWVVWLWLWPWTDPELEILNWDDCARIAWLDMVEVTRLIWNAVPTGQDPGKVTVVDC